MKQMLILKIFTVLVATVLVGCGNGSVPNIVSVICLAIIRIKQLRMPLTNDIRSCYSVAWV